ncbi:hypothetical protein P9112_000241 [Eukaryota sp. TZLM1-RC]
MFTNISTHDLYDLASSYPIRSIALLSYAVSTLWGYYLSYRQHRRYKQLDRPTKLEPYIPAEQYRTSRLYADAKLKLGFVSSLLSTTMSILFLTTPLFTFTWNWAYQFLTRFPSLGAIGELKVTITLVILSIPFSLITSLPFSIYGTFVIEERFGFNKCTPRTFVADTIKGLLLKLLLAPLLTGLVIYVIKHTGPLFYIYLSIVLFVLSLLFSVIIPNFIMPIFNKFTPIEDDELKEEINKLSQKTNFPIKEVYQMDASKRSKHSNAFFIGLFPRARKLVLYDTLIEQLDNDEIIAVLAHEVGHKKKRHTLLMLVLNQVSIVISLFLFSKALEWKSEIQSEFGLSYCPIVLSITVFFTILGPSDEFVGLLVNFVLRSFERQADRFAVRLGGNVPLDSALIKLNLENLSDSNPDPLVVVTNYSHPPLLDRLEFIEKERSKVE